MSERVLPPLCHATAGPAATPMAVIRAIVAAYVRYGRDPAQALAQANIAPQQLAEVEGRVTAAQMELMSGYAMQELDDGAATAESLAAALHVSPRTLHRQLQEEGATLQGL